MATATLNILAQATLLSNAQKWEKLDWGHQCLVDDELSALRIAYAQRGAKFGVEVKHCPNINKYAVTIFNERAKQLGFTR